MTELPLKIFLACFVIFLVLIQSFISSQLEGLITALCLSILFSIGAFGFDSLKSLWNDERGIFVAFSSNLGKNLYALFVIVIAAFFLGLILILGIVIFLLPPITLATQIVYSVKNASLDIIQANMAGLRDLLSGTVLESMSVFIFSIMPEWLVDFHFGWLLILQLFFPFYMLLKKYINSPSGQRSFGEGEFIINFTPLLSGFNHSTFSFVIAILLLEFVGNGTSGFVESEISLALRMMWAATFLFLMYCFVAFSESVLTEVKKTEKRKETNKDI